MKYLIDSDIASYLEDRKALAHRSVMNRFASLKEEDEVYLSIVTLYEMKYSVANSKNVLESYRRLQAAVDSFQTGFPILPLTEAGADIYGDLKAAYRRKTGMNSKSATRHNVDLILASVAIEFDAVVVSNDQIYPVLKELEPGLRVENWTADSG